MDFENDAPGMPVVEANENVKCTTANGQEIIMDKTIPMRVALNRNKVDIPFSDMSETMPMRSVRRHCHRWHRCRILEGGGYFKNKADQG